MTTIDVLLAYTLPLGIGLIMLAMPKLSRGSTFYAVTVPADFPDSPVGQAIHRRYLAGTLGATMAAMALITPAWLLLDGEAAVATAYLLGSLVVTLGTLGVFVHCRHQAMRFSRDEPNQRTVSLAPRERLVDIVPRPLWLHALPYLIVALPCVWLLAHWNQIPDPVLLPGQSDGTPKAYAKDLGSVFALPLTILLTILFCHLMMPLGLLIRRLPGHGSRIETINWLLLWVMLLIGLMGGWNSLAILYGETWVTGAVGMTVNAGLALAILVVPLLMLWRNRISRPGRPHEGDQTPDACWKLGMIYYNPADQAVWVEKRFGIGYTLNFARPLSWILLTAILLMPVVAIMVAALL